jgi:hypothetical protein
MPGKLLESIGGSLLESAEVYIDDEDFGPAGRVCV